MSRRWDVIVVGAGHAGVEAAAAAARLGAAVAVVTLSRERIGEMPCNPAVGGVGKGHLTAEIDAFGGVQGWAADRAGIQFRRLNASRGPAVWGPRVQCDKRRYRRLLARVLAINPRIDVLETEVVELVERSGEIIGVRTAEGDTLAAGAVVVTTGTFLHGVLHTGSHRAGGGRVGEPPSRRLGESLGRLGLELRRFKTGTPPRLVRETVDLGRLRPQPGDEDPEPFSWRTSRVANRALCWQTRTPPVVHEIVRENLHRSPLYAGAIQGVGPRYCPSIEDKIVRFPHHERHTLFLEPETVDGPTLYVNGLATSLPRDVQDSIVHSVDGLSRAVIARYGYAVEYDVVAPGQLRRTLETQSVGGLFLAGQVLGSSGYEEAAGQGLVAGINAAARSRGQAGWVPGREIAYLGVLVDDLVTKDHREPYRMLTARAEHRLVLGVDSARERLMPVARELGLIPARVFHVEQERWAARREALDALESVRVVPDEATRARLRRDLGVELIRQTTWAGLLRRQDVDLEAAVNLAPPLAALAPSERSVVAHRARYAGYVRRTRREIDRVRKLGAAVLPEGFDPAEVPGLRNEVVEQLRRFRPRTLAEAERVPGVTPAAMAVLAAVVSRSGPVAEG